MISTQEEESKVKHKHTFGTDKEFIIIKQLREEILWLLAQLRKKQDVLSKYFDAVSPGTQNFSSECLLRPRGR
jgi:hypothetical protein